MHLLKHTNGNRFMIRLGDACSESRTPQQREHQQQQRQQRQQQRQQQRRNKYHQPSSMLRGEWCCEAR